MRFGYIDYFLITNLINFRIILMKRLINLNEDIKLWQIQVGKCILILCSSDILLNYKLYPVIIQLMPYPTYDIRFRLFLAYFSKQTFHIFQFIIHNSHCTYIKNNNNEKHKRYFRCKIIPSHYSNQVHNGSYQGILVKICKTKTGK